MVFHQYDILAVPHPYGKLPPFPHLCSSESFRRLSFSSSTAAQTIVACEGNIIPVVLSHLSLSTTQIDQHSHIKAFRVGILSIGFQGKRRRYGIYNWLGLNHFPVCCILLKSPQCQRAKVRSPGEYDAVEHALPKQKIAHKLRYNHVHLSKRNIRSVSIDIRIRGKKEHIPTTHTNHVST